MTRRWNYPRRAECPAGDSLSFCRLFSVVRMFSAWKTGEAILNILSNFERFHGFTWNYYLNTWPILDDSLHPGLSWIQSTFNIVQLATARLLLNILKSWSYLGRSHKRKIQWRQAMTLPAPPFRWSKMKPPKFRGDNLMRWCHADENDIDL